MPSCCGKAGTCACRVAEGRNINVTGVGSSQDPFVIAADIAFTTEDTTTFNLIFTGEGTLDSPWTLSVQYADSARLTDLPDVDAAAPGDWQVLAFNPATEKWEPAPPATATPGGMTTDGSMDGDGSVGDPLLVRTDEARYVTVTAEGVALTDAGINQLVRVFPDAPSRDAASPAPALNALSLLATAPGRVDFWNGGAWESINNGIDLDVKPGQMLSLSGAYAGGEVTQYVAQLAVTTAADGTFEVISTADLATYAGVLSVLVQPVGATPWVPMLHTDTDRITATAYRIDDGTAYSGSPITAVVSALLY